VFILIIAALVTVVDLAFNAWLHELYLVLGIFIPLIVTNCIVLARVEAFAAKNEPVWLDHGTASPWASASLLGARRAGRPSANSSAAARCCQASK
jgi:electron transport complex protein RnfE